VLTVAVIGLGSLYRIASLRGGGAAIALQMGGTPVPEQTRDPQLRRISASDIADSVAAGLRDFQAAPQYGLFFGGIYAVGGVLLVMAAASWGMLYLAYPLAAGFALIGPFVAVGLYEVSRRRETGEPLGWSAVLGAVVAQSRRELGWMAFVTVFIFMLWMYQVRLLLALFFGFQSFALRDFLTTLLTTPEGWTFLLIGHVVGAVLSLVLFSLTVVSFPLLLDRDVDFQIEIDDAQRAPSHGRVRGEVEGDRRSLRPGLRCPARWRACAVTSGESVRGLARA
jgi:uncharacterized membrane protein